MRRLRKFAPLTESGGKRSSPLGDLVSRFADTFLPISRRLSGRAFASSLHALKAKRAQGGATHTPIPNFDKAKYLCRKGFDGWAGVLPDGREAAPQQFGFTIIVAALHWIRAVMDFVRAPPHPTRPELSRIFAKPDIVLPLCASSHSRITRVRLQKPSMAANKVTAVRTSWEAINSYGLLKPPG